MIAGTLNGMPVEFDLPLGERPPEYLLVSREVYIDMKSIGAEIDARDAWRARGANWRRVKREATRAFRSERQRLHQNQPAI